jgi:hypothetical protein
MQFNTNLTIKFPTAFDDYGKPTAYDSFAVRCAVLQHDKRQHRTEGAKRNAYDLVIIMPHKAYEPYADMFENQVTRALMGGFTYEADKVKKINDFSGKAKYYEISFIQVVGE